ncbi:type II toxin-antitoxin system death-on-curing family toxin [Laceyella putida]|uniref:Type II toxin-antitoxin system death-on-curing family toxin n=1 Tax=Laceyella putida TaxID=110101 RepID=A0ABW2RJ83_9BACL
MGMIRYLSVVDMIEFHHMMMSDFGEGEQAGVMFEDRLLSIAERPKSVYFGVEIFPTIWEKAGALVQSLVQVHPFHNGNKRTALVCLDAFLYMNGYDLTMPSQYAEDLMVAIAVNPEYKGDDGVKAIARVIRQNTLPI